VREITTAMLIEGYRRTELYCMLTGMGTETNAACLTPRMRISKRRCGGQLRTSILLQLCCVLYLPFSLSSNACAQETVDPGIEQQLFSQVNQERVKTGLSPLALDERLSRAARKHTQLMVQNDSLAHQFEAEESLPVRLRDENVRCDHDGENVALDSTVEGAHLMLMQSPLHRANILGTQFNAVGIGILKSGDLLYITEDFAHVLPNYSEPEADAVAQRAIGEYAKSQNVPVPTRTKRPQLQQIACDMALDDKLDSKKAAAIPGVSSAVAWTATDLGKLPPNLKKLLAQPLASGYSLGVCFAPSVSHPGGVYWLVMVIY